MTPTTKDFESKRWQALALLCVAQFVVVLDASIVNVALPTIGDRPRLLAGQPLLGGERVRAHLRRLPPARRPARRPARPPADLHRRPDPVRRRLARRRIRRERAGADRRARGPGPRRGAALAGGALDRDDDLQGRLGAKQGARRLGRGRRLRRRRRRPSRRRADRVRRLGVGPLGERPDRPDRGGDRAAPDRREPGRVGDEGVRLRRRVQRHRGARRPRLRARRGAGRRLGLGADDRPARRRRSPCSAPSSSPRAAPRIRWSRSRSSG